VDGPPDRLRQEARQRWRLVVRGSAEAQPLTQRELAEAWEQAVGGCGLPAAWTDAATPRIRLSFGAPLPVGVAGEAELIDLYLTERLPTWHVRERLSAHVPAGWTLVDLYDVWLAGPALPGRVVAADYRIELDGGADAATVTVACARLLAAETLPRDRVKAGATVRYDLRPLLADVGVAEAGPPVVVRTRTRFNPELGTGRPDEVIAALAEAAGQRLEAASTVRERLILAEEDRSG
jgi:radical SAM-linked protein